MKKERQCIYFAKYEMPNLKNGVLLTDKPLTLSHRARQSTLELGKTKLCIYAGSHCSGSLRSPTVINSNVSRCDTEENANKCVCACVCV